MNMVSCLLPTQVTHKSDKQASCFSQQWQLHHDTDAGNNDMIQFHIVSNDGGIIQIIYIVHTSN